MSMAATSKPTIVGETTLRSTRLLLIEKPFEKGKIGIEHSSPETDLCTIFCLCRIQIGKLACRRAKGRRLPPRGKETKRRKYIPIQGQVTALKKVAIKFDFSALIRPLSTPPKSLLSRVTNEDVLKQPNNLKE